MNDRYDCIVIGGGPAGSTAATLTAAAGNSTLLIEREQHPRFHVGESLMPETYWPLEKLVASDIELGFFDQLRLRGLTEETMMAVRLLAHWLSFGPPLILATFPAAALLAIDGPTLHLLLLGLLAGTPGLAAIGLMIAALTASLRAGAALSGLLMVPLALPILIFGAGALARQDIASLGFVAAISLGLVAMAPFAAGAAIKAAREV